jgi:hypothetical protein
MNVQELHTHLQEIIDEGNGDMTVFVQAMTGGVGGSRHTTIESVFYGFDWDKDKVLIKTTETLLGAAYAERRRESARKAGEREGSKKK